MQSLRKKVTAGSALAMLMSMGMVGTASASHVNCGDLITEDTTLDSDIGPCANGGLTILGDDITLNLNGFRIFGTSGTGDGVGVRIAGGSNVRVGNGTITDFDAGVAIIGGSGNRISRIIARDNIGSASTDFGDGLVISDSSDNLISGNVVDHNGPFDGIGVFGATSTNNTITRNVVTDNNIESSPTLQQDDGIRLEPGTSANIVTRNLVEGSGLDGIALFASSPDNIVRENVVRDNGFHDKTHRKGDGIRAFTGADRSLVESNRVTGNAASGIRIDSMNNQILTNRTSGNNAQPDLLRPAFDLYDTNVNCDANVWSNNTFGTAFPPCTTT